MQRPAASQESLVSIYSKPQTKPTISTIFEMGKGQITAIDPPKDQTMEEFESAVVRTFDSYKDGSIKYNNLDFNASGRNSNAFAAGLLTSAGVAQKIIDQLDSGGLFAPGLKDPVDLNVKNPEEEESNEQRR